MNATTLRQWCQWNQNDAWLGIYWWTNVYGDIRRNSTCLDIFWGLLCLHLNMSLVTHLLSDHEEITWALITFFTKWGKWQWLPHRKLLSGFA